MDKSEECNIGRKKNQGMKQMLYKSIDETIGGTPLVELTNIEKEFGLKAKIFGSSGSNTTAKNSSRFWKHTSSGDTAKALVAFICG